MKTLAALAGAVRHPCSIHLLGLVAAWLLALNGVSSSAQTTPDSYTPGIPWLGATGVRARISEIMANEMLQAAHPHTAKILPQFRPDFQNLPSNPQSPDTPNWPPATNSGGSV